MMINFICYIKKTIFFKRNVLTLDTDLILMFFPLSLLVLFIFFFKILVPNVYLLLFIMRSRLTQGIGIGLYLNLHYEEWCKGDAGQPFFYW